VFLIGFLLRMVLILLAGGHSYWYSSGQKLAPLERGFFAFFQDFSLFRLQFFSFLIVFIIFDIEVILISAVIIQERYSLVFFVLLLFVLGTLVLEFFLGKVV
jgi:NADH:ubiquinone oxidoreductase subunit 3 (subunit A)